MIPHLHKPIQPKTLFRKMGFWISVHCFVTTVNRLHLTYKMANTYLNSLESGLWDCSICQSITSVSVNKGILIHLMWCHTKFSSLNLSDIHLPKGNLFTYYIITLTHIHAYLTRGIFMVLCIYTWDNLYISPILENTLQATSQRPLHWNLHSNTSRGWIPWSVHHNGYQLGKNSNHQPSPKRCWLFPIVLQANINCCWVNYTCWYDFWGTSKNINQLRWEQWIYGIFRSQQPINNSL